MSYKGRQENVKTYLSVCYMKCTTAKDIYEYIFKSI